MENNEKNIGEKNLTVVEPNFILVDENDGYVNEYINEPSASYYAKQFFKKIWSNIKNKFFKVTGISTANPELKRKRNKFLKGATATVIAGAVLFGSYQLGKNIGKNSNSEVNDFTQGEDLIPSVSEEVETDTKDLAEEKEKLLQEKIELSDNNAKGFYEKHTKDFLTTLPANQIENFVTLAFRYRNNLQPNDVVLYTDREFRNIFEQIMYTPFRCDLEYFLSHNQINWHIPVHRADFDLREYHSNETYGGRIIHYLYECKEEFLNNPKGNHNQTAKDIIELARALAEREYVDPQTGNLIDLEVLTDIEKMDISMTLIQFEGFCESILKVDRYSYSPKNNDEYYNSDDIFGFYAYPKNVAQWGLSQSFASYGAFNGVILEDCEEKDYTLNLGK